MHGVLNSAEGGRRQISKITRAQCRVSPGCVRLALAHAGSTLLVNGFIDRAV